MSWLSELLKGKKNPISDALKQVSKETFDNATGALIIETNKGLNLIGAELDSAAEDGVEKLHNLLLTLPIAPDQRVQIERKTALLLTGQRDTLHTKQAELIEHLKQEAKRQSDKIFLPALTNIERKM